MFDVLVLSGSAWFELLSSTSDSSAIDRAVDRWAGVSSSLATRASLP
jgi:hypothetical protein